MFHHSRLLTRGLFLPCPGSSRAVETGALLVRSRIAQVAHMSDSAMQELSRRVRRDGDIRGTGVWRRVFCFLFGRVGAKKLGGLNGDW